MNYIWCLMIIVSIVVSIFNGTVDQTINSAFEGAKSAVFTVLSFAGVMCFWTGIMKIAENAGLSQKLEKLLKPIIKAMQCLDKENNNPLYTSKNMCTLVVLNTTSVQLIPTTIIALRVAAGSANPFSVILPIWISSFTAAFIALTLTKLLYRE